MKKYLDPRQGSYFGPMNFIFSVFSQKIRYSCHEQKKHYTLEVFTWISLFNVHEILLCKFCLGSLKTIEM